MSTHEIYQKNLVNRTDVYFVQYPQANGVSYTCRKIGEERFLPIDHAIRLHFSGEITLSLPAVSVDGLSKWCCFDSDAEDGALERIELVLRTTTGLNPLRESKRPGRDGHSWIFFDKPVQATDLIRFSKEIMAHAGASSVEFFPKFEPPKHSQVRGPFGIHRKPCANGMRGWFEGVEQNIESQLAWLDVQPRSSAAVVNRIVATLRVHDKKKAGQKRFFPSTNSSQSSPTSFRNFRILEVVNARKMSAGYEAQCPICRIEGHDHHEDNLRISSDGTTFTCVFQGPGMVHKAPQIIEFLRGGN